MIRAQIGGEKAMGADGATAQNGYHVAAPSTSHVTNRKAGLEAALAYKNFKLQGEYGTAFWDANTPAKTTEEIKADVDTGYIEALWTPTGESYSDAYKKGAFGMLKPRNEFNLESGSGLGLWEFGVRADYVALRDGSMRSAGDNTRFQGSVTKNGSSLDSCNAQANCQNVSGGATSYTGGVKWVWNPNLLFKANYTYTDFDKAFAPIDIGTKTSLRTGGNMKMLDHENLLMIRGQFMF
jgi:phosphate-selective porin